MDKNTPIILPVSDLNALMEQSSRCGLSVN